MVEYVEYEKRRVSTSSQTNYPENQKIFYTRPVIKPYSISPVQDSLRKITFKMPDIKIKAKKEEVNKVLAVKNMNSKEVDQESYYNRRFNAENWSRNTKNNFPNIKVKIINLKNSYWSYEEKNKRGKRQKKKHWKSDFTGEDLFKNINERPKRQKEKEYVMHKTFYDILDEISQRKEKMITEKAV